MKYATTYISLLLILSTCNSQINDHHELLTQADLLSEVAPDSAYKILQSIHYPEEIPNQYFAYWCLISGKIFNLRTDTYKTFLPALFYERACEHYMQYGSPAEKSYIRLYLGRAYQETAEYNKAIQIYSEALTDAKQWEEYNAAGMICCQMGDIYHIQYYGDKSREKYNEAIDFFELTGNQRAIALTLSDIGFEYVLDKKPEKGLVYLLKADSIANSLKDSNIIVNISQDLGSSYIELKEFSLAKIHLLKALQHAQNKEDSILVYYALSDVYIEASDYNQAQKLLEKGTDKWTKDGVNYYLYKIEKGKQNFEQALVHLEAYQDAIDSTQTEQNKMHTLEIEKKYDLKHTENQKNKAHIDAQQNFILLLIVLAILLFTIILYQLTRKQKNKIIAGQHKDLSKADGIILHIQVQLQQEKDKLQQTQASLLEKNIQKDSKLSDQQERISILSEELFTTKLEKIILITSIGKKIRKTTKKVTPDMKGLSIKEWETLNNLFRKTFPSLENLLWNPDTSFTRSEINLSLLTFFNLDTKQESIILDIAPASIYKQRTRLRQTLQLDEGADIFEYFRTYCIEHE